MDKLTEQYFRAEIDEIKEKLEERRLLNEKRQILQEMAVHCKPGDLGYNFTITVAGSTKKNNGKGEGAKKEHNPPHAHIITNDGLDSRFQIVDKAPPQKPEDLKVVDPKKDDSLAPIADKLIKWINAEPIRAITKGNKNNWEAMRDSWKDIQDIVNQGLKNKIFLD